MMDNSASILARGKKLLTETKALKRWCSFVLYPFEIAPGVWVAINRKTDNANPQWARCQTNDCVHWKRIRYDTVQKEWVGRCGREG